MRCKIKTPVLRNSIYHIYDTHLSLGDESTEMVAYRVDAAGNRGCGRDTPRQAARPATSRASNASDAISTSGGTSAKREKGEGRREKGPGGGGGNKPAPQHPSIRFHHHQPSAPQNGWPFPALVCVLINAVFVCCVR